MNQFASYTNGLRDVTLTLTAQNGTSISKTTAYDANGSVSLDTLDKTKDYTLRVTGTDKTNSKQVTFASELTKEITPDPIPDPEPNQIRNQNQIRLRIQHQLLLRISRQTINRPTLALPIQQRV